MQKDYIKLNEIFFFKSNQDRYLSKDKYNKGQN